MDSARQAGGAARHAALLATALCLTAGRGGGTGAPERARLPGERPDAPALLFGRDDIAALRANCREGWLKDAQARLCLNADRLLATSTSPYALHGAVSGRAAQYQVLTLAFAAHVTGDARYSRTGREVLLAFCDAGSPGKMAELGGALAVGDACHALAVGYDWLASALTLEGRRDVLREVEEYGTWLFKEAATEFWGQDERRRQAHNWAAVTHGALGLAALVLGHQPEWVARATYQVRRYFQYCRDETGAPYEGMSYGAYGLQNAVPFAVALRRTEGRDLLADRPNMLRAPDHLLWHVLPWGGQVVPLNQSSGTLKPAGGMMHLLVRAQSRTGLWGWLQLLGEPGDGTFGWSPWLGDAVSLPYVILFGDPALQPLGPSAAGLPLSRRFSRGQVAMRDGWTPRSALVTFTCGEGIPGVWNQGDEGSFTLYALGESFAVDCGAGKGRTADHNAILIDGEGQSSNGGPTAVQGDLLFFEDRGPFCIVEGDAGRAYSRRVPGSRVRRRLVFIRRPRPCLLVVDDVAVDDGDHEVTWLLHSATGNTLVAEERGARILGQRSGAACAVRVLAPSAVRISCGANDGRHGSFPQLSVTARGTEVRFAVLLMPQEQEEAPPFSASVDGDEVRVQLPGNDGRRYSFRIAGREVDVSGPNGTRE